MQRKTPNRMCVSCRRLYNKADLMRIVRTPSGEVLPDPTGKMSGRGAYLCNDPECRKKCVKGKLLNKIFKAPVSDEFYNILAESYEH